MNYCKWINRQFKESDLNANIFGRRSVILPIESVVGLMPESIVLTQSTFG